jgi:prevent-host-death family protein
VTKTAEVHEFSGQLAELIKQVQAGNEIVLTQGNQPVAKIVPAKKEMLPKPPLKSVLSKAIAF